MQQPVYSADDIRSPFDPVVSYSADDIMSPFETHNNACTLFRRSCAHRGAKALTETPLLHKGNYNYIYYVYRAYYCVCEIVLFSYACFFTSDIFMHFLRYRLKKTSPTARAICKHGNWTSYYLYLSFIYITWRLISCTTVCIFLFAIGEELGREVSSLDEIFENSKKVCLCCDIF